MTVSGYHEFVRGGTLLLCGRHRLRVLRIEGGEQEELFSYHLADAAELDAQQREWMAWYHSTDDAKPVCGGRMLITSVGGCVAFLEPESRRLTVFAWANGAHSAEMVPGGLVAVAISNRTDRGTPEDGHRVALYDPRRPFEELWQDAFRSAHGAVWDAERSLLWVVGYEELRTYRLCAGAPQSQCLVRDSCWRLPWTGGHDLQPVPGGRDLLLSVSAGALLFDRDTREFRAHPFLGSVPKIKSLSMHLRSRRLAVVQAEEQYGSYAGRVRLYDPPGEVVISGPPVYKARWLC